MPYTINKYNGAQVTVVADGTIDSTLDIKLIGKNYAGYGEIQNENFLFLLENFANPTQPPRAISGQIWYDSGTKKLKFFDGSKFRTTGGAEVGPTEPTGLTLGDFWWDSAKQQLYAYNGEGFTLIGPQSVIGANTTQMVSRSIRDINNISHAVIEAKSNGQTVFVISSDPVFTLPTTDPVNQIDGFTKIHKGITLSNTDGDTGVSDTIAGVNFWGTATNSIKLGGIDASNYVRSTSPSLSGTVTLLDNSELVFGYPSGSLRIYKNIDSNPVIQSSGSTILFQSTVLSQIKTPIKIVGLNIETGEHNVSDLGTSGTRFKTVYATRFEGVASQADTIVVSGSARSGSSASSPNTIAVRDGSSDLYANVFHGTATSARYADLAEKYLADKDYEIGTVVVVGGEKEVTASSWGQRAIGAVSANPAFKMNSELEGGTYIALKGRIPVRVSGAVRKGDRLIAGNDGTAVPAVPHANDVFAIALESNSDTGIKLVESVIL
jgi:hypothetical protein